MLGVMCNSKALNEKRELDDDNNERHHLPVKKRKVIRKTIKIKLCESIYCLSLVCLAGWLGWMDDMDVLYVTHTSTHTLARSLAEHFLLYSPSLFSLFPYRFIPFDFVLCFLCFCFDAS